MAKKRRWPAADRKLMQDRWADICFYGTPEKHYLDSGFWKFLNYVYTKDEHDHEQPVKTLPIEKLEYLQVVWLHMLALTRGAIPKSRQVRMSWAACVFATWFVRTAPSRLVVFQSKKLGDAEEMVSKGKESPGIGRMDFIEQHLPDWLQDKNIVGGHGNKVGELLYTPKPITPEGLEIPWYGSRVIAVPQGADQVRGKTVSLYLGDEVAFWDDFGESWDTVSPAIRSGKGRSKMFAFSSVFGGSEFNNMCLENRETPTGGGLYVDPENTGIPELRKMYEEVLPHGVLPRGMRSWETPSGLPVLEVHYTADPDKRPETPHGKAWLDDAARDYTGGVNSPRWRREMEIDYGAMGGTLVFPELFDPSHPAFIPALTFAEIKAKHLKIYAGYDFGTRHPSAFTVWGQDPEGKWYALWELYERCDNYVAHINKIKACPYFAAGYIEKIVCDPQLVAGTQHRKVSGMAVKTSILQLFSEEGLPMTPGQKGADLALVELMKYWWSDKDDPKCFITAGCPNLAREIRSLRWEEHTSAATKARKGDPEKIMDKNNDAFDSSAYILTSRPKPPGMPRKGGFSRKDYWEEVERDRRAKQMERNYVSL